MFSAVHGVLNFLASALLFIGEMIAISYGGWWHSLQEEFDKAWEDPPLTPSDYAYTICDDPERM